MFVSPLSSNLIRSHNHHHAHHCTTFHRRKRRSRNCYNPNTIPVKPLCGYLDSIPEDADVGYESSKHHHHPPPPAEEVTTTLTLLQLTNQERIRRGVPPLHESATLNTVAARHAQHMALVGRVFHSVPSVSELQLILSSPVVGENVQTGPSLTVLNMESLRRVGMNRRNLLAPQFCEYGSAVCASPVTGQFYACQLFRWQCHNDDDDALHHQPTNGHDDDNDDDDNDPYSIAWLRNDSVSRMDTAQ